MEFESLPWDVLFGKFADQAVVAVERVGVELELLLSEITGSWL